MAWTELPTEIRLMILVALVEDDDCNFADLVVVSKEWQGAIEQHNFKQIRLTPSRIAELDTMTLRHRHNVRYLWFCLELERYDCPDDNTLIEAAFRHLFSVISTWAPDSRLTLDISVYSTSDRDRWFKYLTFEPDTPPKAGRHDQELDPETVLARQNDHRHRWDKRGSFTVHPTGFSPVHTEGFALVPLQTAIEKVFSPIMGTDDADVDNNDDDGDGDEPENEWCGQLPQVPAVKRILLRQQTRRRWSSEGLAEIFAHLPRLSELCYEPWRDWDDIRQVWMDDDFLDLLQSLPLRRLTSLSIFENFNQRYNHAYLAMDCSDIRTPNLNISQMLSRISINFEHLSASFMVDASEFFDVEEYQSPQRWPNLKSLVLTSQLLAPDKSHTSIMDMLREAALRSACMPQLETMEIWNGREGLAALFRYDGRTRPSTLEWRSTWDVKLGLSVIRAWEAASMKRSGHGVELVYRMLDSENILSHADAILALDFPELVIRPVSLHQIQREHSWRRIALT
ncbi:unnamed protein product [Clonostachys rhizophaga]|uniref:DUF6546 domain-containing protein n=1 Tax=Clonostachys rhizophaga TaxID=160324 RepID=A0A9N9VTX9_9HYPO|nr:unnamed protein product [Clonostachys rhizophaga]